jgi:hypothetical protein
MSGDLPVNGKDMGLSVRGEVVHSRENSCSVGASRGNPFRHSRQVPRRAISTFFFLLPARRVSVFSFGWFISCITITSSRGMGRCRQAKETLKQASEGDCRK